ncbi:MAG: hypothetical protein SFW67_17630 [Myxococcaceae bacterium]|nr:hypothetical protein [Myxococcaceae bacterium]
MKHVGGVDAQARGQPIGSLAECEQPKGLFAMGVWQLRQLGFELLGHL